MAAAKVFGMAYKVEEPLGDLLTQLIDKVRDARVAHSGRSHGALLTAVSHARSLSIAYRITRSNTP